MKSRLDPSLARSVLEPICLPAASSAHFRWGAQPAHLLEWLAHLCPLTPHLLSAQGPRSPGQPLVCSLRSSTPTTPYGAGLSTVISLPSLKSSHSFSLITGRSPNTYCWVQNVQNPALPSLAKIIFHGHRASQQRLLCARKRSARFSSLGLSRHVLLLEGLSFPSVSCLL